MTSSYAPSATGAAVPPMSAKDCPLTFCEGVSYRAYVPSTGTCDVKCNRFMAPSDCLNFYRLYEPRVQLWSSDSYCNSSQTGVFIKPTGSVRKRDLAAAETGSATFSVSLPVATASVSGSAASDATGSPTKSGVESLAVTKTSLATVFFLAVLPMIVQTL